MFNQSNSIYLLAFSMSLYAIHVTQTQVCFSDILPQIYVTNNHRFEEGETDWVAAVQTNKTNFLYIGVENPITIAVGEVTQDKVKVRTEGGINLRNVGNGKYIATIDRLSKDAAVFVSIEGQQREEKFPLIVRRIPDPVVRLLRDSHGNITSKASEAVSITPYLENFYHEGKCECKGFDAIIVPPNGEKKMVSNVGADFSPELMNVLKNLDKESHVIFSKIMVKCPGDNAHRYLPDALF